jgi:thermitase
VAAGPTSTPFQPVASVPNGDGQSAQNAGQPSSMVAAAPPAAAAGQGTSDPSDPSGTIVASAGTSGPGGSSRPLVTGAQQGGQTPSAPPAGSPTPTPSFKPPKGARTTIEHRRGQDVALTHLDEETAPDGRPMVAGRILVGFKPGAAPAVQQAAHQAAGTVSTSSVGLQNVTVADVAPGTTAQALAAYRSRPDVAWAEPDYIKRATLIPNDPCFSTATSECSVPQYGPQKISAPAAWDVTQGAASTRVAILDCGIYSESSTVTSPDGLTGHPDLRGKVVGEINFTTSAHGADDFCDHGTLMAGVAGARTNTSPAVGVAGIGFNVSLLNGKVLDDFGDGSDSGVASGITWAVDNGAQVISMSLGGPGPCSNTLQTAVDYAWTRNVVLVAAAGNGGVDGVGDPAPESPGNCNHVIPVGATDQNDQRASFSNYGLAVPLAAPGVSILSTNFVGGYRTVSGTSPATPHVAGVAALLWSSAFGTSNQAIVDRLLATADPITGTGSVWANGRVNAAAAVTTTPVVTCSPRPPVTITTAPTTGGLLVTLTVSNPGNTIQSVDFLNLNAAATNAQPVTFAAGSTSTLSAAGTLTVTPTTAAAQQSFVLKRVAAGQPTTLRFIVHDACGPWTSFVGGGVSAGF